MTNPQEIFDHLNEARAKLKEKNKVLTELCSQDSNWILYTSQKNELTKRLKMMKLAILDQNPTIAGEIEALKLDITDHKKLLTDIVLASFTRGENVTLQTEYQQEMLPIFTVRFEKL